MYTTSKHVHKTMLLGKLNKDYICPFSFAKNLISQIICYVVYAIGLHTSSWKKINFNEQLFLFWCV
jgi:hypothetical protein